MVARISKQTRIQVLLADDHRVVRAGIRQILEREADIRVIAEAEDGEEALTLIEKHKPDVVVLDIQMPKISGIEVTHRARIRFPEVGILILTAYDDTPYVLAVLQAGANGYVLKTADARELVQAVRDVHEGKSVLDPTIARKIMPALFQRSERLIDPLTERELEVLRLAAKGFTNKAIGVQLGISDRTVQGHLGHIFAKLQVNSRTEAVMRAIALGLIPQPAGFLGEDTLSS